MTTKQSSPLKNQKRRNIVSYIKENRKETFNLIQFLNNFQKDNKVEEMNSLLTFLSDYIFDQYKTYLNIEKNIFDFNEMQNIELSDSSSFNSDFKNEEFGVVDDISKENIFKSYLSPSIIYQLPRKLSLKQETNLNFEELLLKILQFEYEVEEILYRKLVQRFKSEERQVGQGNNLGYFSFLKILSTIIIFHTKLKVTITQSKSNYFLVFTCIDEGVLSNKAEEQEMFLKLKNYAVFYKEYNKVFKNKVSLLNENKESKHASFNKLVGNEKSILNIDNEESEYIELCEKPANKYKDYELHLDNVLNFPPHFIYNSLKKELYMEYDRNNSDQSYSFISRSDEDKEYRSIFRNIDILRLVSESISSFLNINVLKQNDLLEKVIYERNTISYKDDIADSLYITDSLSFSSTQTKKTINLLRNIYGEKVSFSAMFQKYYNKWLLFPVIIGIIFYFMDFVYNLFFTELNIDDMVNLNIEQITFRDYLTYISCFLITIWATLFRNTWIQKEKIYSYIWGTDDLGHSEPYRRNFIPDYKKNIIFNYTELRQNSFKKAFKLTVSWMILILVILLNLYLTFLMNYWKYLVSEGGKVFNLTPSILVGCLSGLQISLLSKGYRYIAFHLTNWENHEMDSMYENQLKLKYIVIEFFNCYTSLFYIAFFKNFFEQCIYNDCYLEMGLQVYFQLLTFLLVYILEYVLLKVILYYKRSKLFSEENRTIEEDTFNEKANERIINLSTKPDYTVDDLILSQQKMIILFGYVCFFTVACPFVPLICFLIIIIDNFFFMQTIFKLTSVTIFKRSKGNDFFSVCFRFIYVFGMIINLAIALFTSSHLKSKHLWFKVLLFVIFENVILFSMNLITWNILPSWYDKHIEKVKELYNKKFFMAKESEIKGRNIVELKYKRIE